MNEFTKDLIRKIYEHTHEKISEDDPIITVLQAQQLIVDEFANNMESLIEEVSERLENLQKLNQQKAAVLSNQMGENIKKSIDIYIQNLKKVNQEQKVAEYKHITNKMQNITILIYGCIFVNICIVTLFIVAFLKLL